MTAIYTLTPFHFWKIENQSAICDALKKLGEDDFASLAGRLYHGQLTKEERRRAEWYPFAKK